MAEATYPPVFFLSYARADAEHEGYRGELKRFVDDLGARVAAKLATPLRGVSFFDEASIATGTVWTNELADALMNSRVGVALCTPNYFSRTWCGREFQVFLNRAKPGPGASGIVPVLWTKCTSMPQIVERLQYKDNAFPPEYAQIGMQRLSRLKVYADQYDIALEALAERIVTAANAQRLTALTALDFDGLPSAWDELADANPRSHTEGGLAKTCFVFVSKAGWGWRPYPDSDRLIGAIAQSASGELGVQYEEIKCDGTLRNKLAEANKSNVPTVLFGDPESLLDNAYAQPLRDYDTQFLLNCAAIVPWDESSKLAGDADQRWIHLKTNVCSQKTEFPPPCHEWRSVFTLQDLEVKTRTIIEQLRSRLMKQLMAEPEAGATPHRKAEDATLSGGAAALGISTESPAQLESPTR